MFCLPRLRDGRACPRQARQRVLARRRSPPESCPRTRYDRTSLRPAESGQGDADRSTWPTCGRPARRAPDLNAARHADAISNRIFLEPVFDGHYPADLIAETQHLTDWSFIKDGDLADIRVPTDYLGVNYYSPTLVQAATPELWAQQTTEFVNDPQSAAVRQLPTPGTDLAFSAPQDGPYTAMGWRVEPSSLTELLVDVHKRYPQIPMMVTENGAAYDGDVVTDGAVHDPERTGYIRNHLAAIHDAIEAGADVRGYFVWSLMDNFEWALGYQKRFGVVHMDYETLERTPKDSALWYRDAIAAGGF